MLGKLDQMKDMYALKKQADMLQKKMEKITVSVSEGDYTIVMKGDQTVESVTRDGEDIEVLRKLFNKAVKESQKEVSKKLKNQLGDLGFPGL